MTDLSLPSPHEPFVDLATGKVSEVWYRYLTSNQINLNNATTVELTATAPISISTLNVVSVALASQTDEEAGTSSVAVVTPSVQQYHPSAAKAWAYVTMASSATGALSASYNVSTFAIVSTAVSVTFATPFSSTNYSVLISAHQNANFDIVAVSTGQATSGVSITKASSNAASAFSIACYGDQ